MKRRLAALLLAFVAVFGVVTTTSVVAAPPAVADNGPGIIAGGIEGLCKPTIVGAIGAISGHDVCKHTGQAVENKIKKEWNDVWNSLLGDILKSAEDATKWILKKVITFALLGPSLKLQDTGLFGQDATLAGMMVWLGLLIAVVGFAWQIGKMAVTGQMKYLGQAMVGWVQNVVLSAIGLTFVGSLLTLGDAMTTGLVDNSFGHPGAAYERVVAVMMPMAVENPMLVLGIVGALLLVGFIQMILIFLRQTAIPLQCLMLPIAGSGRTGGETTRQWAPRLINSILVAITYKPLLAIIVCTGFSEFGHAHTLTEWLRGMATLILGVLAPGPLMKVFAPLSDRMGSGLAAGGALGAAAAAGSYLAGGGGGGGGNGGGPPPPPPPNNNDDDPPNNNNNSGDGVAPTNAVEHARHVEQTMPKSYKNGDSGQGGGPDAPDQGTKVPHQPSELAPSTAVKSGVAGKTPLGSAGMAVEVLDGVNNAMQRGAHEIGNGGSHDSA